MDTYIGQMIHLKKWSFFHWTPYLPRMPRGRAILKKIQQGVNSKVMELVIRWRSNDGPKGLVPNLPIRQVYTEVRSTLPTMLEYFQAFLGKGQREGKCFALGGGGPIILLSMNLKSSELPISSSMPRCSNHNTGYWEYGGAGIFGKVPALLCLWPVDVIVSGQMGVCTTGVMQLLSWEPDCGN
jgi:hypothetical protein